MHAEPTKHRLHALCPYFAMFPHTFVRDQILSHTFPGDIVLDPFSGRGTAVLESLLLGRQAIGIDINPVAACVTGAKAHTPDVCVILSRLHNLEDGFKTTDIQQLREEGDALPSFFRHAFHRTTLHQILFLRRHLDWKHDEVDCFICALALGSLHGEMDKSPSYFSNQMPRTISTKPDYSVRYWQTHHLVAPERNAFAILRERAKFRLKDGRPSLKGVAVLGDARNASGLLANFRGRVKAVVTSPPYLDITNYEEDQWLRLWFLGNAPWPTYSQISRDDRHTTSDSYWRFLAEAWQGVAPLLGTAATIVCRIGAKKAQVGALGRNLSATILSAFPKAFLWNEPRVSLFARRQTDSFRPGSKGCGFEVDFVFRTGYHTARGS